MCGEVIAVDPKDRTRFASHSVVAMFEPGTPQDGLVQYALVRTSWLWYFLSMRETASLSVALRVVQWAPISCNW